MKQVGNVIKLVLWTTAMCGAVGLSGITGGMMGKTIQDIIDTSKRKA